MTPGIPEALRARVREQAENRCGYCLARQEYVPWVLEIEHIIPKSKGGTDDEENLWLACHSCNWYKSDQTHGRDPLTGRRVRLFDPPTAPEWRVLGCCDSCGGEPSSPSRRRRIWRD